MPGPADNVLKHLTELSPEDWVVQGGWQAAPARLIDADIATITGATDKVIRVEGTPDWLLAVDFQAGHDTVAKLPDLLLYKSALFRRHRLRVRNLLVLLHPGADSPQVTGWYERGFPGEPFDAALRYRVVRVWQVPAEQWLAGGLGVLPLAPMGEVLPEELPAVIARMKQRVDQEAPPGQAADFWLAAFILMGYRYEETLLDTLLRGDVTMQESVTYQAILRKGRTEEARKLLLLLGRDQFGEPSADVQTALDAITDPERLEQLFVKVKHAASWRQLLGLNG